MRGCAQTLFNKTRDTAQSSAATHSRLTEGPNNSMSGLLFQSYS